MENINLTIILAQIANFLILFLIFKKFIADKLVNTIKERRELFKKLENAEEKYKETLKMAEEEKAKIIKEARDKAHQSSIEIERLANKKSIDILLRAENDANMIIEWWRRQLEKDRLTMLSQMKSHIIDLSLRLNEKLFDKKEVSKEFMEKELEKIKKTKF